MPEPSQRRIAPSSTLTRSFPGPGTPRATRCIEFFTPRDSAGLKLLDDTFSSLFHCRANTDGYPLRANLPLPA